MREGRKGEEKQNKIVRTPESIQLRHHDEDGVLHRWGEEHLQLKSSKEDPGSRVQREKTRIKADGTFRCPKTSMVEA